MGNTNEFIIRIEDLTLVLSKLDFGTDFGKVCDGSQVCSYLRTVENILDNGMLVINTMMNLDFNLALTNGMNLLREHDQIWQQWHTLEQGGDQFHHPSSS